MIQPTDSASVRRKIESLSGKLSLPTVRKALGVLEGEHSSSLRGGANDVLDIRAYEPGDESRMIDWRATARQGRPMVAQRERLATSRVWLLLDVGREMTATCESGERASDVAANALLMFASLSLRRSDDISLVFADESNITRVPFNGGFAQFEQALDKALTREWKHSRNIDALLDYALRIKDREALIVIATDEHALSSQHAKQLRRIARTHPVVLIDVATLNPFGNLKPGRRAALDGHSGRTVPAFLRTTKAESEVTTHRAYTAAALEQELTRGGSRMIQASSSEQMFRQFVALVSNAQSRTTRNQLKAAAGLSLGNEVSR